MCIASARASLPPAKVAVTGPVLRALRRTRPTGEALSRLRIEIRDAATLEELLAVYEAVAGE